MLDSIQICKGIFLLYRCLCSTTEIRFFSSINGLTTKWEHNLFLRMPRSNISIWKRVKITHTKIKLMPPERKNPKFPSIRYLNLNILSLDVVVYTCCKYNADRRVIHPTSVRRNIKLKDAVRVARFAVFCIVFCRSLFVLFLLAIVMSFLLWFTASDYLFGIFKLFFV